jgi:hypothetical protein
VPCRNPDRALRCAAVLDRRFGSGPVPGPEAVLSRGDVHELFGRILQSPRHGGYHRRRLTFVIVNLSGDPDDRLESRHYGEESRSTPLSIVLMGLAALVLAGGLLLIRGHHSDLKPIDPSASNGRRPVSGSVQAELPSSATRARGGPYRLVIPTARCGPMAGTRCPTLVRTGITVVAG